MDTYPNLKNRQRSLSRVSVLLCVVALVGVVLPFMPFVSGSALEGAWALVALSILVFVGFAVTAFIFGKRAQKMDSLISGAEIVKSWKLSDSDKRVYSDHLFASKKGKNKLIFTAMAVIMTLVFGFFIIFMKDGRLAMFLVYLGVLAVVAFFAFGMPYYYRWRNLRGDGYILIGRNFAYVNGYFHNWDFPLSGLEKMEEISKPFRGLLIQYYYVDRTLRHVEVLMIPYSEPNK